MNQLPTYSELLFSPLFFWPLTVFIGLVFGSFATALSYRLPRGISIVSKAHSTCNSCGRNLTPLDLVPVFSWVLLRGRCRGCGAKIGWRYPLIELATLILCLGFYARFGASPATMGMFLLAPVITSIVDIDLHYKIIPDSLNLSIAVIALVVMLAAAIAGGGGPDMLLTMGEGALAGMLAYGLGSIILRQGVMLLLKKDPMGWGDIKFFAAAGAWLGAGAEGAAAFMLVAGLAGVFLALLWQKLRGEREFPFGPAIILAFIVVLLWQGPVFLAVP
ncbi:MAG: prepilin peptidase [Micavibrio sp.]|nr:prepilin peptidase [Micavibrio sp.]